VLGTHKIADEHFLIQSKKVDCRFDFGGPRRVGKPKLGAQPACNGAVLYPDCARCAVRVLANSQPAIPIDHLVALRADVERGWTRHHRPHNADWVVPFQAVHHRQLSALRSLVVILCSSAALPLHLIAVKGGSRVIFVPPRRGGLAIGTCSPGPKMLPLLPGGLGINVNIPVDVPLFVRRCSVVLGLHPHRRMIDERRVLKGGDRLVRRVHRTGVRCGG